MTGATVVALVLLAGAFPTARADELHERLEAITEARRRIHLLHELYVADADRSVIGEYEAWALEQKRRDSAMTEELARIERRREEVSRAIEAERARMHTASNRAMEAALAADSGLATAMREVREYFAANRACLGPTDTGGHAFFCTETVEAFEERRERLDAALAARGLPPFKGLEFTLGHYVRANRQALAEVPAMASAVDAAVGPQRWRLRELEEELATLEAEQPAVARDQKLAEDLRFERFCELHEEARLCRRDGEQRYYHPVRNFLFAMALSVRERHGGMNPEFMAEYVRELEALHRRTTSDDFERGLAGLTEQASHARGDALDLARLRMLYALHPIGSDGEVGAITFSKRWGGSLLEYEQDLREAILALDPDQSAGSP